MRRFTSIFTLGNRKNQQNWNRLFAKMRRFQVDLGGTRVQAARFPGATPRLPQTAAAGLKGRVLLEGPPSGGVFYLGAETHPVHHPRG